MDEKLATVNNGKNIQYFYDHTGARTRKVVDGLTTEYRMAGDLLLSEKTGTQTYWYRYDSGANLISVTIKGKIYFYVRNAQNDIIGLIDAAGNMMVKYEYDSWGKLLSITGSLADTIGVQNPFRYRGYYYDNETGMYYLKSRYYDPEIRRFISADNTEILEIGAKDSLYNKNIYTYCDNNSIVRNDNSGNIWVHIAIGAVIGGIISGAIETVSQLKEGKKLAELNVKKIIVSTLSGAVSGAFAATGWKLGSQIVANTAIGVGSYAVDAGVSNSKITMRDVIANAAGGAVSGLIGGSGANGSVLYNNWKVASKAIVKESKRNSFKYSAKIIARNTALRAGIKKTVGISVGKFVGGTLSGRKISGYRMWQSYYV